MSKKTKKKIADKRNIIIFDLETLPNLPEIMKVVPSIGAWPGRTMKSDINSVICFGYKKLGSKKTHCINAWDFKKRWDKDINDDYEVVKAGYEILKDADAIITHNGIRFDWKVMQTRLMHHGLPRLPRIPHIDTCSVSRSNMFLYSNSLNNVAKFTRSTLKMQNGGWGLWVDVFNRKKKAMKIMTAYCKQDVDTLEEVFEKLRPYVNNLPNYNLFTKSDAHHCPNCGSLKLHKHGVRMTKTGAFQRYQCQNCAAISTTSKSGVLPRSEP